MTTIAVAYEARFLFCYLKTKPTKTHKAKRDSWEVTWAASTRSPRAFFPFPSLFLSSSLTFEDRRRKIEIVTYSRVPFVRMSTGRRHGAQLHRRPIVPQSRFVTVTYGDIPRREIAVEASNGRSTLLFPILFAGMSRAVPVCVTCFRYGMARCCLIFHRWEPLAHAIKVH